ncbi:MAG: tRNA adenosine(34) deaminase TadA [Phycisphaerales bacterium]
MSDSQPTSVDIRAMERALELARAAAAMGEVPIGAVVYRLADGAIIGEGANRREVDHDPTAHAEILAIKQAAMAMGDWRLEGCALAVTLEPCPMCAGAIVNARIARLVFGAPDPKAGACGTLMRLTEDVRLNHRVTPIGGVMAAESAAMLKAFFANLRSPKAAADQSGERHPVLAHPVPLCMGGLVPGWFMLMIVVAVPLTVVIAIILAWRRMGSHRVGTSHPVCGGCGYALAPNPSGLTVCPECGGDFLSVGILAPKMKYGRRGSPVVPLVIAWFVLVAAGMVPMHGWLTREFTRQLSVSNVRRQSSGSGAFRGVNVNAVREQLDGAETPDRLSADATITGPEGNQFDFTVDGISKTITKAPADSGLRGQPWNTQTAKKAAQAAGAEAVDDDAADKVHSIVTEALGRTTGGGNFLSSSSTSSSFGTFGTQRDRLRKAGAYIESGTGSSFGGGGMPVVVIGSLRGGYWVTLLVCISGLLLIVIGAWLIALVTRPRRGEAPVAA